MINSATPIRGQSIANAFATLTSQIIAQKFQLGIGMYGPLFLVLISLFDFATTLIQQTFAQETRINFSNFYQIFGFGLFLCIVGGLVWLFFKYYKRKRPTKYANHTLLKIYRHRDIDVINQYINLKPECFKGYFDMELGSPELEMMDITEKNHSSSFFTRCGMYTGLDNSEITFYDRKVGYKGFIMWKNVKQKTTVALQPSNAPTNFSSSQPQTQTVEKTLDIKYFQIYVQNFDEKPIHCQKFLDDIKKEIDQLNVHITTFGAKEFGSKDGVTSVQLHRIKKTKLDEMESKFIDTFFHPEKHKLWTLVKKVHFEPEFFYEMGQIPSLRILFYGPPGTGKSTFSYRVASALGRHIYCVDIKSIRTKKDAIMTFQYPRINGHFRHPKEVVFVVDEFDIGVTALAAREQERREFKKFMETRMISRLGCSFNDEYDEFPDTPHSRLARKRLRRYTVNKVAKKNEKEGEKDEKSQEDQEADMEDVVDEAIQDVDMEFCVKDLLDILQGCIPAQGMILFATTNNFEKIQKICPALFRPGRLTPVEFGYVNQETIQEISQFFYKQPLNIDIPEKHTVSTAAIIEKITNLRLFKETNNFQTFQHEMKKLFGIDQGSIDQRSLDQRSPSKLTPTKITKIV